MFVRIDVFSKYAWVVPMKSKDGKSSLDAFQAWRFDFALRCFSKNSTQFFFDNFQFKKLNINLFLQIKLKKVNF